MSLNSMDDTYMAVAESPQNVVLEQDSTHMPIATAHFAKRAKDAEASAQRVLTFVRWRWVMMLMRMFWPGLGPRPVRG